MRKIKIINRKIALLNHSGGGNLGDDATILAVLQNIRLRWPSAEIHAFTMNPEDSASRHGIPCHALRSRTWSIRPVSAVPRKTAAGKLRAALEGTGLATKFLMRLYRVAVRFPRSAVSELRFLLRSWKTIRSFGTLVVCGGGQLTERDGPWAFPWTILMWVLLGRAAGLRCLFLNVGVGPLNGRLSRFFAARALAASDYVSFRDESSEALARISGYSGPASIFPDNACLLNIQELFPENQQSADRCVVGFASVPYGDPTLHPAVKTNDVYQSYLHKNAEIVSWLAQRSYSVELFSSDVGVDPQANDDLLQLLETQGTPNPPHHRVTETLQDLFTAISAMDYVITCRFHGVVFAKLLNKPVLAIAHHPKVTQLMDSLGLSEYCFDIRDFDPEQVKDKFAALVENADAVQAAMAARLSDSRMRLTAQFNQLFPTPAADHSLVDQGMPTAGGTPTTPGKNLALTLGI